MKKSFNTLLFMSLLFISCSSNNDESTPSLEIGQSYQGGIIFYLDETGQHGLIASENDQATNVPWTCTNQAYYEITSSAIGTGQQNTTDIINSINSSNDCPSETFAAQICADFAIDGYSDWYLPSFDELTFMYEQRLAIGNFEGWFYWSSTELNENWTRVIFFEPDSDFSQYNNSGKDNLHHVRAIRSF